MLKKTFLCHALVFGALLVCTAAVAGAEAPASFSLYQKEATWQQTMLACRERLAAYQKELAQTRAGVKLGPWYATKPLPAKSFADVLLSEEQVDPSAKDAEGKSIWQEHPEWRDGKVHDLHHVSRTCTYLLRTITVDVDKPVCFTSGFGSNDGLVVWLNGEKLLSNDVGRSAEPDQDIIKLDLLPGENRLLVKIHNRGSACQFYFLLQTDATMYFWQRIASNFGFVCLKMKRALGDQEHLAWFGIADRSKLHRKMVEYVLDEIGSYGKGLREEFDVLKESSAVDNDRQWLDLFVRAIDAAPRPDLSILDAPLLFVKRHPYMAGHIYDDYITWHPGGGIYVIENPDAPLSKRRIRPVIDPDTPETLGVGVYRDPDISWDGKHIVFAFKGSADGDTSIYEIGIDGEGLRRLTEPGVAKCTHSHGAGTKCSDYSCTRELPVRAIGAGWHDVTPAYLPDGRIVFTSTRPAGRVPCFNSAVDVLHVMDGDGKNVRCISINNVNEFDPAVLPDGRILFGRWEYVDKTALYMQSLWTIFPDGTNETALFANNLAKPTALLDARPVSGTQLVVTALTPHNGQAVGAIAMIDPRLGKNNLGAVTNFTPKYPTEMDQGLKRGPSDPWPLSKDYVLIANNDPENGPHGVIELISRWGHRNLVHAESEISCYSPMLVKAHPGAKKLAVAAPSDEPGTFFVQDIHRGLKGVRPGDIKHLRVIEETTRVSGIPGGGRWWNQAFLVSWQGAYTIKNILGVVPVYEDGSAYFEAPAGQALYFEALDEQGREIQRMRTFVKAAPGVTRSCVGCHESKMSTPRNGKRPIARLYPPAKPKAESWGSGFVDYPTMIQPILDKHCVSCHGGEKGIADGIDLSGGWTWAFNISYETLIKNTLVGFLNCHNSSVNTARILAPRTHGSGAAPLTELLLSGHKGHIKDLSRREQDLILAWMDTNCNYYGTWNWTEHATCNQIFETAKDLTTVMEQAKCTSCHAAQIGSDWINLRRPEYSRILRAPLAKSEDGLGLGWCRQHMAREVMTLVNQSHQPPDVFSAKSAPKPDLAGEPVVSFASAQDGHYQAMLNVIAKGRELALAKARVDMPGANINAGVCRHLAPIPLPKSPPALRAELHDDGVLLSWLRSAEMIGLTFELHRGKQADFTVSQDTLSGTTTMFQFKDQPGGVGTLHYALVAVSNGRRSRPAYASITVR
jgi:hypothetical protein